MIAFAIVTGAFAGSDATPVPRPPEVVETGDRWIVLEARVGEGELSLRGVNPVTLAVPDALLVDVDTAEALAALETEASR